MKDRLDQNAFSTGFSPYRRAAAMRLLAAADC
jgi:hypothetical protein